MRDIQHQLKKEFKTGAQPVFPLLLLSTASTLLPYHALFTVFIIFACSLFAFMYIFQDCPLNKLFIYLIIYIMIVFIQLLSIPLIQLCRIPQDSILMPLFGNSFCLLISVIHYRLGRLELIYKFIVSAGVTAKIFLGNSFILIFCIVNYVKQSTADILHNFFFLFLISLLVVCINGVIIYGSLKIHKQKQQIEMYHSYLPIVEQLIDQVRETQHAHNNSIQAIRMLPATCHDYETLSRELTDYTDYLISQNAPVALLKINMKMIAGFLYHKILRGEILKKKFELEIRNYCLKTDTPEYDLITMFGVLIDNAIEASNEGDTVYAVLDSRDNRVLFQIKNIGPKLTPEFSSKIFQKGYTTKKETKKSHGHRSAPVKAHDRLLPRRDSFVQRNRCRSHLALFLADDLMLFRDLPVIRSLSPVHKVRIDSRFPDRLDQQLLHINASFLSCHIMLYDFKKAGQVSAAYHM